MARSIEMVEVPYEVAVEAVEATPADKVLRTIETPAGLSICAIATAAGIQLIVANPFDSVSSVVISCI